jgi:hypothetical protein
MTGADILKDVGTSYPPAGWKLFIESSDRRNLDEFADTRTISIEHHSGLLCAQRLTGESCLIQVFVGKAAEPSFPVRMAVTRSTVTCDRNFRVSVSTFLNAISWDSIQAVSRQSQPSKVTTGLVNDVYIEVRARGKAEVDKLRGRS